MAISDDGTARQWLVEFFAGQIRRGVMSRDEASAHIRAAAERASGSGSPGSQIEAAALAMIAALPHGPDPDPAA
jgi:hypothetical protein